MGKFWMVVAVVLLGGWGLQALAQFRGEIRPQVSAIGVASSNGVSHAWFYDATERAVYVCRSGHAGGDAVECRAKATLP